MDSLCRLSGIGALSTFGGDRFFPDRPLTGAELRSIGNDIIQYFGQDIAIIESTQLRFRPILLTALATILGMIPLLKDPFWGPMGAAIAGGLMVATVLTLLYLPALYALWFRVKES